MVAALAGVVASEVLGAVHVREDAKLRCLLGTTFGQVSSNLNPSLYSFWVASAPMSPQRVGLGVAFKMNSYGFPGTRFDSKAFVRQTW